jgi:hypothetical protein
MFGEPMPFSALQAEVSRELPRRKVRGQIAARRQTQLPTGGGAIRLYAAFAALSKSFPIRSKRIIHDLPLTTLPVAYSGIGIEPDF